jgi:hypothetical protein
VGGVPTVNVPVILFPPESAGADPVPSSNFQWAISAAEAGRGKNKNSAKPANKHRIIGLNLYFID